MQIEYTLTVQEEDMPVRGNAHVSEDSEYDKKVEDDIIRELDHGNVWAWCMVKVTAKFGQFEGYGYLGGCSYKDEADFKADCGSYEDLKKDALDDLRQTIRDAKKTIKEFDTLSESNKETPKYTHDCSKCQFLGSSVATRDGEAQDVDVYYCTAQVTGPTILVRFGNDGGDYASGLQFVTEQKNWYWIDAARQVLVKRALADLKE